MKKHNAAFIILAGLLVSIPVRANREQLISKLKQLNETRVASGVKAVATGVLGYYALIHACQHAHVAGDKLLHNSASQWQDTLRNLAKHGIVVGGMLYTTQALAEHGWRWTKHALDIK